MSDLTGDLLTRFEAQQIAPSEFGHRQHVQVAFEMLHRYGYIDACTKYSRIIKTMAEAAGASHKFNVTITFAFLSLIAQRISQDSGIRSFETFIASNKDLMSRSVLNAWYSSEELQSEFARTHFMLPAKVA